MTALQRARADKGWTLAEAASKLGVSRALLRALEGGVFGPNEAEMAALKRVYGAALSAPEQLEFNMEDLP